MPNINGDDGRKLSKRRNAVALDDFRNDGLPAGRAVQLPRAARLELRRQDDDHVAARAVERFALERIVPSPATFDYKKLDWMNGVYLRNLQPDEYAHDLLKWLHEQGIDWPDERVRATVPLVQEKIEKFSQYPDFVRFLFEDVEPPAGARPADLARRARAGSQAVEPWEASAIEEALRALADELGQKPRQAFAADPPRHHGLEGLARALREPRAARQGGVAEAAQRSRGGAGGLSGFGGANGSRARWKPAPRLEPELKGRHAARRIFRDSSSGVPRARRGGGGSAIQHLQE